MRSVILNPLTVAGIPDALVRLGLSGVVYGVFGNDPAQIASLGDAVHEAPYKAPPQAPVLYVKPRNTLRPTGSTMPLALPGELALGASLGIVVGRTACRVEAGDALAHVAGYVPVVDLSLVQPSYYRPNLRMKALDGSCFIGAAVQPAAAVADPDAVPLRVEVDGVCVQQTSTHGFQRGVARLFADVTEFMTLRPGDVLLLGIRHPLPPLGAGSQFRVDFDGIGSVSGSVAQAGEGA